MWQVDLWNRLNGLIVRFLSRHAVNYVSLEPLSTAFGRLWPQGGWCFVRLMSLGTTTSHLAPRSGGARDFKIPRLDCGGHERGCLLGFERKLLLVGGRGSERAVFSLGTQPMARVLIPALLLEESATQNLSIKKLYRQPTTRIPKVPCFLSCIINFHWRLTPLEPLNHCQMHRINENITIISSASGKDSASAGPKGQGVHGREHMSEQTLGRRGVNSTPKCHPVIGYAAF